MPITLELKTLDLQTAAREKADLLLVLLPAAQADAQAANKPAAKPAAKASAKTAAKTTAKATAKTSAKTAATASAKISQASAPEGLAALIDQASNAGDLLLDKPGNQLALYSVAQVAARKVVLLATGKGQPHDIAKALQTARAAFLHDSVKKAVVLWQSAPGDAQSPSESQTLALVQALDEATYQYQDTKPSAHPLALEKIVLGVPNKALAQDAFARAQGITAGIALARQLGNLPANHATPEHLAHTARELAQAPQITAKIHGLREIERLKMGAFLSVARGSAQPPQFIELHYQGAAKNQPPVVLVGKGVTFDTGGISLKPAASMDEMKFDMCGAASVLGVFQALAQLQPRINVVGLIPATENMPGGKATKPGDVVTSLSGQTIEILNTDAEGRLILCDALSYADRFKPRAVVDIATLTGACVIALGKLRSGLYANDDALAQALLEAGEQTQDRAWRMPLDDDYASGLKSHFADMANVAGREAGSVTAAKFLQKFTGDWPWAHLDIAGAAWKSGNAKGATGRPVGLLMHYLLGQAS
ncbi:leucyl aminopeptidase [Allofranklinella schreckenbergeri]|uniref:Probable cytosol aminopeptidase n=1 Tax=Allofranklinella schreckenbergeri TaxID=1076744 RepID=A0A3M6QBB1_9BURK|nr:leucyl aminopeptidase [Allofranklinella schreckenbergeri]RMW99718.1 leucyl aminopeptidase [Allofranklinella schreckenbergeri]